MFEDFSMWMFRRSKKRRRDAKGGQEEPSLGRGTSPPTAMVWLWWCHTPLQALRGQRKLNIFVMQNLLHCQQEFATHQVTVFPGLQVKHFPGPTEQLPGQEWGIGVQSWFHHWPAVWVSASLSFLICKVGMTIIKPPQNVLVRTPWEGPWTMVPANS